MHSLELILVLNSFPITDDVESDVVRKSMFFKQQNNNEWKKEDVQNLLVDLNSKKGNEGENIEQSQKYVGVVMEVFKAVTSRDTIKVGDMILFNKIL